MELWTFKIQKYIFIFILGACLVLAKPSNVFSSDCSASVNSSFEEGQITLLWDKVSDSYNELVKLYFNLPLAKVLIFDILKLNNGLSEAQALLMNTQFNPGITADMTLAEFYYHASLNENTFLPFAKSVQEYGFEIKKNNDSESYELVNWPSLNELMSRVQNDIDLAASKVGEQPIKLIFQLLGQMEGATFPIYTSYGGEIGFEGVTHISISNLSSDLADSYVWSQLLGLRQYNLALPYYDSNNISNNSNTTNPNSLFLQEAAQVRALSNFFHDIFSHIQVAIEHSKYFYSLADLIKENTTNGSNLLDITHQSSLTPGQKQMRFIVLESSVIVGDDDLLNQFYLNIFDFNSISEFKTWTKTLEGLENSYIENTYPTTTDLSQNDSNLKIEKVYNLKTGFELRLKSKLSSFPDIQSKNDYLVEVRNFLRSQFWTIVEPIGGAERDLYEGLISNMAYVNQLRDHHFVASRFFWYLHEENLSIDGLMDQLSRALSFLYFLSNIELEDWLSAYSWGPKNLYKNYLSEGKSGYAAFLGLPESIYKLFVSSAFTEVGLLPRWAGDIEELPKLFKWGLTQTNE